MLFQGGVVGKCGRHWPPADPVKVDITAFRPGRRHPRKVTADNLSPPGRPPLPFPLPFHWFPIGQAGSNSTTQLARAVSAAIPAAVRRIRRKKSYGIPSSAHSREGTTTCTSANPGPISSATTAKFKHASTGWLLLRVGDTFAPTGFGRSRSRRRLPSTANPIP